ncbi:hypothetical protein ACLOJK_033985 [Asimina triloba]
MVVFIRPLFIKEIEKDIFIRFPEIFINPPSDSRFTATGDAASGHISQKLGNSFRQLLRRNSDSQELPYPLFQHSSTLPVAFPTLTCISRGSSSSSGKTAPWSAAAATMKEVPSNLVGSIVEKGFSSSSKLAPSFPQPTVLPFPVARHRSHGPHWAPVRHEKVNDEDDPEDLDEMDIDPVAAFANPIKRKQKKGLDFSNWRELVTEDDAPVNRQRKLNSSAITVDPKEHSEMNLADLVVHGKRKEVNVPTTVTFQERVEATRDSSLANINGFVSQEKRTQEMDTESSADPNGSGGIMDYDSRADVSDSVARVEKDRLPIQGSANYERARSVVDSTMGRLEDRETGSFTSISDIDAENHALLQRMSPEEIAQTQVEIMGRFKPGILAMLKKRGQDKLRKSKDSASEPDVKFPSVALHDESYKSQESQGPRVDEDAKPSNMGVIASSKNAISRPDDEILPKPSCATDSSLWNLWTSKVEKVRELRFSLDGSVVEKNSPEVPISGNLPTGNQFDVENVAERDFLRTEGDPGAAGYTIKEAVALIRSMVPGQRALALQLLATVLEKAMYNLQLPDVKCNVTNANIVDESVDWQAVWAFALGPEPELVLSLRMSLDDNHISVVLASMKVIQCILCCEMNENFFNISEKLTMYKREICTAPVFRSRQEIVTGFLHGGFWKYGTKPSNLHPFNNESVEDDETDIKHTIQDDVVVAGQDVAAGLIRMGILPRLRYLLETDPVVALEETVLAVLVGLARHSPTCANAVMECPRLVLAAINRFSKKDEMGICPPMIRSVTLLKALALSDKKICKDLVKHGIFQDTMWHLYKSAFSFDQWMKSGKEYCKLTSALMVEQLGLWKVCIQYGYCISYFPEFFPAICFWLCPPSIDKLIQSNVLNEYASVAREAYLTLAALVIHLPYLHVETKLEEQSIGISDDNSEIWSWSHVLPMVDFAMNWISLKNNPYLSSAFNKHRGDGNFVIQDSSIFSLLWVISAVMHMLASVLERISPMDTDQRDARQVPWLPEFVPKIGIEIVKSAWLTFSDVSFADEKNFPTRGHSFLGDLCQLRHHKDYETSLASSCCLNGLIQLVVLVDKYIKMAQNDNLSQLCHEYESSREDVIVKDGMVLLSQNELSSVLSMFMNLVSSEWHDVQSVEMFGRGGPAPGIGLGWGASGGGFWSRNVLQTQTDLHLVVGLLEIFPMNKGEGIHAAEEITFALPRINCILESCLIAGPRDKEILGKAFDILLQHPVLKLLDVCIRHSLLPHLIVESFRWEYDEEDYLCFSRTLNSHLRKRWLDMKHKSSDKQNAETAYNKSNCDTKKIQCGDFLDTIPEDRDPLQSNCQEVNCNSLVTEWTRQRLPLPMNWFLSPVSTMVNDKAAGDSPSPYTSLDLACSSNVVSDTVKSGLFFLLGLEAVSFISHADGVSSPIQGVHLVWKIHALSMALLVKMDLLEERRSRDTYRTLQELYGKLLDQSRHQCKYEYSLLATGSKCSTELLKFKTDVHESYTTFIETLVEQFAATSYGDEIYGRQVAIYLHHSVETPVRLATWNALSTAHVLELLPPIGECVAEAEGYLQPVESPPEESTVSGRQDDEGILEAYTKSWISGGLDKAALRGSMSFTLVLHHLASFIFLTTDDDKLSLKKKLLRSLLRDYSRKQQHQIPGCQEMEHKVDSSFLRTAEIKRRLDFLSQACEGNSSLSTEVEKLRSSM